jgi:hypothetical protein
LDNKIQYPAAGKAPVAQIMGQREKKYFWENTLKPVFLSSASECGEVNK